MRTQIARTHCSSGWQPHVAWLTLLSGCALMALASETRAIEFRSGDLSGRLDTTLSAGATWRVESRDPQLIGGFGGGTALSANGDDGNLNYDKGDLTSMVFRATHDLDVGWRNYGAFARLTYFYDTEIMDGDTDRTPLGQRAEDLAGRKIELLDAYVTADYDVGNSLLGFRLGNQTFNWGESTFIPNGLNSVNVFDVTALRQAGSELRNALKPLPAVDVSLDLTNSLAFEGFYLFQSDETEIEPRGTFFSTNDFISPDGEFVYLGFGSPFIPDIGPTPPGANVPIGTAVPRAPDRDAGNNGQYGFALRYFAEQLNATEFGLYYMRQHSRLPIVSARTGTFDGVLAGDYAGSARYFAEYPEDIDVLGASFNAEIGTTGWALQGEGTYRIDQPLQIDDTDILFAALSPISPALGQGALGSFGFDEEITGFRRKDVVTAQATVSKLVGRALGADSILLLGELGLNWVPDLEDKDELRYNGPGSYTSGNDFFTQIGAQPATTPESGFADGFSTGYRLLLRATYNNALGPVTLSPRIAFLHDVIGTTPEPLGTFVQNRKAVTLGLSFDYLTRLRADVSYTTSFGAGQYNQRRDRDFIAASLSWSF